jgi:SpoIID/LytB domain protein
VFTPSKNSPYWFVFSLLLVLGIASVILQPKILVHAEDEIDQIQRQIDELAHLKSLSEAATAPLEEQVKNLDAKITSARNGIQSAKTKAQQTAQEIDQRETDLAYHYTLFSNRIAASYRRARTANPLVFLLASTDASQLTKNLAYQESAQAQDDRLIRSISEEIAQLEADKKQLESDQQRLATLENQLNEQAEFFKGEIAKAKDYQAQLSGQIASLTAKQQAIINARSGSYTTSVGEVPLADDFNASIAFKSQAPGNSFAVFSFGAYTHRNGMSQYGAKARAEAGQNAETILKAYYPGSQIKTDYPEMSNISVEGVGTISFEDQYLLGIYEIPESWPAETLKAQAIAARTFAIRYTSNGQKSICTSESCQVFKNSPKSGAWKDAVMATRGQVLVDGSGSPISTQYASTHGGYTNMIGWDLNGSYDSGSWSTNAWENKASSPWFYKAWYRNGYSSSGASCGRNHPWLSQEEFSDIINAWIVRKNPNGADADRIEPVTINECNIGGQGGNPYSMSELREKANNSGGAVTNVSSVSVSHSNSGSTTTVTVNTNRGSLSIPGDEFKTTFNLRAPGYLRIPQSGFTFFNIEFKN